MNGDGSYSTETYRHKYCRSKQAANGTNTESDRQAIQKEVECSAGKDV